MDLQTVLTEVDSWPVADRLRLMEGIWESLVDQGYEPELTEEMKAELDRRLEEMDRNRDAGVPWELAKARVLGRFPNCGEDTMGESGSPPVGPFDDFLTARLKSDSLQTKFGLARDLYEAGCLGERSYRNWKRALDVVERELRSSWRASADPRGTEMVERGRGHRQRYRLRGDLVRDGLCIPHIPLVTKVFAWCVVVGLWIGWSIFWLASDSRRGREWAAKSYEPSDRGMSDHA